MGTPLADHHPLDGCAAYRAGQPGTAVGAKMILKVAAAVHPIDGRAVALNTGLQHAADGRQQIACLRYAQVSGILQRVQARQVQVEVARRTVLQRQGFQQLKGLAGALDKAALGLPLAPLGVGRGAPAVILGHVALALPYVILVVSARLATFERALEEAARNHTGVCVLDGGMVDKPMELRARTTLAKAEAAGIKVGGSK